MKFTTLLCASLLLANSTAQPSPPAAEATTLAWNLQAGADYRVHASSTSESTVVTMGQEQEETMTVETDYRAHVEEVTEEGNMELTITVDSYFMSKQSAQLDIELSCARDEDGTIQVVAELDSELAELQGDDVVSLFETIGRNNMELEFTILLTPSGTVESSSLEGDPMANLPTDTDVTQMIADTASAMIDVEDLAGMLASQIFSLLPEKSVEVEDEWDVARHFIALGLEMDGAGRCTLNGLKTDEDTQLAVITEEMLYSLGTEGLEENMADMMAVMFEKMGLEMEVYVDLDGEDMDSTLKMEFDIVGGFNRSMTWSDVVSSVSGTLSVGEREMDMQVESTASGSSSWSRLEEE